MHAHIVPDIDDGSTNLYMSMELIKNAYAQGVRHIVCTSHSFGKMMSYNRNFKILDEQVKKENIPISLYTGCEIDCSHSTIDSVVKRLDNKIIPTINNTRYVLIEFSPYEDAEQIIDCVRKLQNFDYKPVLAHIERYQDLFDNDKRINSLVEAGCLFQINAFSLQDERNINVKLRARYLLSMGLASFIGSDAHRVNHRTYSIQNGIEYVYKNCQKDYADAICYKNATKVFNIY